MGYFEQIDKAHVPTHIAIVMDGNGRWAKAQGKDRIFGHLEGVRSVKAIVKAAAKADVKYLTLYTFSTENFNRPAAEVSALMGMFIDSINKETDELIENGVRGRIIGDMSRLSKDVLDKANEFEQRTSGGRKLTLILAFSYSSRWEITNAARNISHDVMTGKIKEEDIDENLFSTYLATKDIPDPDLFIRTGGEIRISNYLLWQTAYTELYFTDIAWPDFKDEAFYEAIVNYQSRERRFGKTSEQVQTVK